MNKYLIIVLLICLSAVSAAEKTYTFEQYTAFFNQGRLKPLDYVSRAYSQESNDELIAALDKQIKPSRQFSVRNRNMELVSAIRFLNLLKDSKPSPELVKWLLANQQRFYEFTYLPSEHDDMKKALSIIDSLYRHDPEDRDAFSSLIFAYAIVWDQARPLMHNFIGKAALKYKDSISERYDLHKAIYKSKSPGMSYKNLNARMLIYVVDLPVPISEIKWAMKYEKGRASSWSKKFNYVRYDVNRFNRGQFVWNRGQYNLLNVRKNGGICIDRAYYTVITARVWGIPAMLFTGKGRNGGHAWLGLMKFPGKWTMDLHRYSQGNYSAGNTRNPQTNELINDHELSLLVSPEFFSWGYYNAVKINELASVYLKRNDHKQAISLMADSIRKQPLYEPPWNGIYDYYMSQKKYKEAYGILRKQAISFSRYKDKLVTIYNKQIDVLEKMGKSKEADYIRKSVLIKMRKRDDIMAELTSSQAEEFIAKGKKEDARKVYEKFISSNAKEGFKILETVESYLEVMERTEQLAAATKFLKSMVGRVPKDSRGWMEGFLLEAYEKNGDERDAEKLKERMRQSRKDIDF